MDGRALKDLFTCDLSGLDMSLLGLNRFKEQLRFKKFLNKLFKNEDNEITKLTPLQKKNKLTM